LLRLLVFESRAIRSLPTELTSARKDILALACWKRSKLFLPAGVPAASNALGAHGYRRVVEYLEGKRDLESAIEQTNSTCAIMRSVN